MEGRWGGVVIFFLVKVDIDLIMFEFVRIFEIDFILINL